MKKDIRTQYLNFFAQKGHKIYDSMPLVPDDASLLFTNAGMVQFKDIFTNKIPTPTPPKATSSQLCIRAGGKHNDLENVGYTARHHTLFEMLGNFSFGDYFKEEAISFAWEFVTKELGFDKSLLYVTIHESDDEAYELWCKHIEPSRIKRMGDKDNFWQMGDSGPCGPCSEIYVDQGEKYFHSSEDYFGGEGDRFLEIWNLVFMQYEQKDGVRKLLPKPSIDTGMGLERVIALLEGKINNFDTSLFAPLMSCIEKLTGEKYYYDNEVLDNLFGFDSSKLTQIKHIQASFRVIADHARSVAFLLAQGVNFDKEGRGYVLRRILRRAIRHGYLLGLKKPFLCEVVGVVCESMGEHYTYLKERKKAIIEQCKGEEERFFETLENGMSLFNKELKALKDNHQEYFSGETAFKLYDTYGFPLDLTQDMLKEHHIQIDMPRFEICMNEQKAKAKASWKGSGDSIKEGDFNALLKNFGENLFVGYEKTQHNTKILALLDKDFHQIPSLKKGERGFVMLEQTPFYPQSGGPIGDSGILMSDSQILAKVLDTQKYFGLNLSMIESQSEIKINQEVLAKVDESRFEIAKHHSATHLLHLALREILGSHIAQAGSLVESNRLRFDFSHPKALTQEELIQIQENVNRQIFARNPQKCENMGIKEAKAKGAMALFGEKYGDIVRVITFGDSVELCGGIHVENTAHIGSFYITKESGVSSGVRRIEAVCGKAAYEYGKAALETLNLARESLKNQDILQGIQKLKTQVNEYKTKANKTTQNVGNLDYEEIGGVKLIISKLSVESSEAKEIVDKSKNENDKVAILLVTESKGKIAITAGIKNANLKAGAWVKQTAQILGGNGGGRDDFATAGGKDISKIQEALEKARAIAIEELGA
ncbi:MAG: alanine--tRNA ligase [Helicobacter sp.]|nr:alanine--tRNA ligase [Helicobacter sp.]